MAIVGIGNPMRGDDGVGLRAAELAGKLAATENVAAFACEPSQLPERLAGFEGFVLIDALDSPLGDPMLWSADEAVQRLSQRGAGSHGFGVVEALRLMSALGTLPPQALVVGIPVASFEIGSGLCIEAEKAAQRAARLVAAVIRRWLA